MISTQRVKRIGIITVIALIFIVFQNYMNKWIFQLSFRFYPIYKSIDPDNAFIYLYLHHIIQTIIFITLIIIAMRLFSLTWMDFGLNFTNYKKSILYTLCFVVLWAILQFCIGYLMVKHGTEVSLDFPLNTRNITGYFLFEILLTGTSEELFFRGLVITILTLIMKNYFSNHKITNILAILISTIIFMAGHINFESFPFRITYIDGLQQLTLFIFGTFYSILFIKTKSLLGPMLAHNLLNGVATLYNLIFLSI